MYSCTPNGLITAIDADTGKARWKFDSHSTSPFGNAAAGLATTKMRMLRQALCARKRSFTPRSMPASLRWMPKRARNAPPSVKTVR
ncbi:hypothetical protein IC615_22375 [Serratia ureilytica]